MPCYASALPKPRPEIATGEIVELRGPPANPEADHEFIADCCRYQEGIATEQAIKAKYRFADEVWEKLGENEKLLEAIADEKVRRIRTGQQKRERSQHLIAKAPAILDSIACDVSASPRHRVDAIKMLNDFSRNGPEGTPASDRFQITIVLNGDVERFDKSIEINANDTADPHSIGSAPPVVAAITKTKKAKNKLKDNDDGDAI